MKKWLILSVLVLLGAIALFFFYKFSSSPAEEQLVIKGSDTEVQLVSNLVEAFLKDNPEANISVTGGGSGVGIAALINSEISLANSSRQMKDEELAQAKENGLDVQEFILARDGLSVIVHPDNPVKQLTLAQIANIYQGKDSKYTLYGRQSTSGTYVFFRDVVVKNDYSPEMKNMEGSQAIVDAVIADKTGIGYVGVGYVIGENSQPRKDIKIISVAKDDKSSAFSPLDEEAIKKRDYPIVRAIFQYLAQVPKKGSLLEKFLLFEMSPEGEKIIKETGFYLTTEEDKKQNQEFLDSSLRSE